jgi:hypothetical protein
MSEPPEHRRENVRDGGGRYRCGTISTLPQCVGDYTGGGVTFFGRRFVPGVVLIAVSPIEKGER